MSFFNFIKVVTYLPFKLIFPTKVYGKEKYFDGKSIVCVNHFSSMDAVVLASKLIWGECRCVAKEELFDSKISAWFLSKCGAISVRRGESDISAYKRILGVLREGKQLIIFPEGTRNKLSNTELLPFQSGTASFAMKSDAPIIPVVYYRHLEAFKKNYMLVGDPIELGEFKDLPSHEAREKATEYLYEKMSALKLELEDIVENKKKKKK